MELLLLALASVVSLLLVTLLSVLLYRQNKQTTSLLYRMIQDRETREQSLLNQLRTMEPYTLLSLNAATGVQTQSLTSDNEYVPMGDSAEFARFSAGIGDELTQEDYAAFGEHFLDEDIRQ